MLPHIYTSHHVHPIRSSLVVLTLLTTFACGGGGGNDGGSTSNNPAPAPSPIPVDPPEVDPRQPSNARIALQNGDAATNGFVIGNIEDAALAADGSLALIAAANQGDARAVLRMAANGTLRTIFDESNAPAEVDLSTLSRLRMASTGELAFQSGNGLDTDQLHRALDDEVETIAGIANDPETITGAGGPEFRILGNFRIVRNGRVAFVGGGGDCEVDSTGDTPRDLCTVALFLANESEVVQIEHEDFELDRRQANDAQIGMNEDGELFFSVPGRRRSPVVVQFDGEDTLPTLRKNGELPEGVVARIDIVDLDTEGRLLVELGFAGQNPDDPVRDHIGLLDGDQFTDIAAEGSIEADRVVASLRGTGLGGGRALFQATLRNEATGEETACLRLGDSRSTQNIVCEGDLFPGEELEVFSTGGTRINEAGDVLFVTTLGTRIEGTTRVEETRASVRRANGEFVTIVSSLDTEALGTITNLTSVGFNNAGQALLIAERDRSNDRVLFLGDSR
ncbi:MAG: hypothetical protein P8R42_27770 [Candidatus Binatia bacterium]|nr:hypothetical protein [Candidatus Binatia bacterium]